MDKPIVLTQKGMEQLIDSIENPTEPSQALLEAARLHGSFRVRKSYDDGSSIHVTLDVDSILEDVGNGISPDEIQKTVESEMDRIHSGNYKAFKFNDSVK